jgi:hypothetical protein
MSKRLRVAVAIGLVLSAVAAAAAVRATGTGTTHAAATTLSPRKEARFERGEANRRGPANPAAEQVENRAWPLGYVDDHRAVVARKAYESKGSKPTAGAFGQRPG